MSDQDLGGLRAYAREVSQQFETLRHSMTDLQQELRSVSAAATSADGFVTATVGARGQLQKLDLDPRIYRRQDSAALAQAITQTIQAAVTEAAQLVQAVTDRHAPGVDMTSYLRGDIAKRFERFTFIDDQISGGPER